ncbi:MAG: hypothetical protein V8R26_02895 [Clostridia bacterium]|nr:hypothetical protein [Clostridiaceae bacterium]
MEEKKTIKVSLGTVICIVIIFLLLISIIIMYYSNKNKNVLSENKNNISNENVIEKRSIKNDDSKELVYDANYAYKDFSDESYYSENMEREYSLKDINLPYININSEDANKANKEIEKLFEKLAEFFEQEYKDTKTWYNVASYKTYTKGNLLSILITVESGGTDVEQYKYYTYNFNLSTLKMYSYEEIYKLAGFTSNNIDEKVEEAIKKSERITEFKEDITTYIEKSIKNYTNSVKDQSIQYFIDENNELNVIVKIELPVGVREFDTIIKVK